MLGVLFLAILATSLRVTRLWCRAICPLGALLGAVSRWSFWDCTRTQQHATNATAAC